MTTPFCHPRKSLAGIHQEKVQDGCPINNAGHDDARVDSRESLSGMTQ
ncbi:MAG: hypothetical protein OEM58_01045 [Nitrospirota bacterium]|nr:hypothetical protein [Nitrospirota bacterium]